MEPKNYRLIHKKEIRDFCYRENLLTTWDLVKYAESTSGDSRLYRCQDCGNEQYRNEVEFQAEELQLPGEEGLAASLQDIWIEDLE